MRLVDRLLTMPEQERALLYRELSPDEIFHLDRVLQAETDNPFVRYEEDAEGFINGVLGETLWSKQRDIIHSVVHNSRTAVAACHAPGKSWLSARLVSWWVASHAPGTALAITIAPTHRQVRNIIWPHIRRCHYLGHLPGEVLTSMWKVGGDVAAYGFSPSPYDEAATQGIHSPNLLIVIDEAGGISEVVGGALEALMTGGNTRLLLLGNPPTDDEDSWFERCFNSPLYNPITISAYDTPNFTGEEVGLCRTCPPQTGDHFITDHLVDRQWVEDVITEFGDDSPFVEARIHARFPRATANKVVPFSWCEQAVDNEDPNPPGEIRLGVDIASDGGDEFVVASADGGTVTILHRSSGAVNSNAVDVSGVVLRHIHAAEEAHEARGMDPGVRVKVDTIGVGWGVVSLLETWGKEGRHRSHIVGVNVSERAQDPGKHRNIRSELWWNGRLLLQPDPQGRQAIRLDVDRKVLTQLTGPTYKADSAGRIQIEGKAEMKRRGVSSPDQAEAILLALYEPPGRAIPNVAPITLAQVNVWKG